MCMRGAGAKGALSLSCAKCCAVLRTVLSLRGIDAVQGRALQGGRLVQSCSSAPLARWAQYVLSTQKCTSASSNVLQVSPVPPLTWPRASSHQYSLHYVRAGHPAIRVSTEDGCVEVQGPHGPHGALKWVWALQHCHVPIACTHCHVALPCTHCMYPLPCSIAMYPLHVPIAM